MPSDTSSLEQQMLGLVAGIFDANTVVLFVPDARGSEEPETSRLAAYCSAGDNVIPDVRIAPGQGLVGWILRSRKPLLVPEFDGEHSNLDYYREGGESVVRSFIGCPLPTGGALCADTSGNHPFTEKDHHILQMCADMIDSIRRKKGAEAIVSEIPGYYLQLGIIEDLRFRFRQWQVYIKNFLLAVAEATGFDYCSFASVNVPGESYCIESENRPRLVQGNEPFYQAMANGLAGWVFRNGQPVVQTGEDGRVPTLFGNSENLPEFSAVICMPVMVNKSTRGVICLGHSQPHAVDETMRTFLRQAVGHLSLYLENLYLRVRMRELMTKAQVYRDGPRLHDPDASPYQPPHTEQED